MLVWRDHRPELIHRRLLVLLQEETGARERKIGEEFDWREGQEAIRIRQHAVASA